MKSIKKSTVIILLLMACLVLCTVITAVCGVMGVGTLAVGDGNVATAMTSTLHTDTYNQLPNGSFYLYTDLSKVKDFRSGNQDTDVTNQKVDTTDTTKRGTAIDPYVITTVAQWTTFATSTQSQDATKVFVLGNDIDFNSATFTPVTNLKAKFYGCNYALKNISYAFGGSATAYCGIFRQLTSTVVADLTLDNVAFSGMGLANGGVAGYSNGGSVLNCHFRGSLTTSYTTTTSNWMGISGMIGWASGSADVYIYRCSALFKMSVTLPSGTKAGASVGGLMAKINSGTRTHIYDSFLISDVTENNPGTNLWFGGIASYGGQHDSGTDPVAGNQEIDGCVAYIKYRTQNATNVYTPCSAVGGWHNGGNWKLEINNTYSDGEWYNSSSSTTKWDMYASIWWPSGTPKVTIVPKNVNWYAASPQSPNSTGTNNTATIMLNGVAGTTQFNNTTGKTRADLYAKAVDELNGKIWVNKAAINTAYMTNTKVMASDGYVGDGYTVYNSPVRNPLNVKVQYCNYLTSGDTVLISGGDDDWFSLTSGDALKTPTSGFNATTHIFMGWTTDKTGATAPMTYPIGLLGEVKLYAVWDTPSDAATPVVDASTLLTPNDLTNTQGTVTTAGSASMTYNATTSGKITLTANLQVKTSVMNASDVESEFAWFKGATEQSGATDSTYSNIQNVADSGTYSYKYTFYSKTEPLWRSGGTGVGVSKTGASTAVTVNPAPIYVSSLGIGSGEHAYVGKRFNDSTGPVTPVPSMVDSLTGTPNAVAGTASWGAYAGNIIKDTDIDGDGTLDGQMKQNFNFTPTNPNYQSGTFEGILDVEYLKINFVFPATYGITISETLEYNQNYTCKNVADLFDSAYAKDMDPTITFDGLVPYLKLNNVFTKIDALRSGTNAAAAAFAGAVKDNVSVDVDMREGTYTVTYDKNTGNATTDISTVAGVNYGQRVIEPTAPTNGTLMFLGWYYDVFDENNNPLDPKKWDFNDDVIKEDITLTAKWLAPSDLTGITVKAKPGATFKALTELTTDQIIVTATFECKMPDNSIQPITTDVLISKDNVVFDYVGNDSEFDTTLHVGQNPDGTTTVNVTYSQIIDGIKKSASADLIITVEPELVPTDNWQLKDQTFVYDGTAKSLTGVGTYDKSKISGDPEYIYLLNGRPVVASLVVDPGTYTVIARFTPATDDFKIDDRRATLTIKDAEAEVSVSWDSTSFAYNGLKQYPKPTFTDAAGTELNLDYTVSGVDNAINVGGYTLTIALTTAGYTIKSGDESVHFSITKATLPVPTLKEGDIIYNGSNINLADHLDGYNPDIMEIASGGLELNAGPYSAVVKFKTDAAANCSWQGSSGSTVNVKWEIKKATAIADWGSNYKFRWDGNNHYPELVGILDVCVSDQSQVDLTKLVYEGDINVADMGAYTVSVRVPTSEDWFKNYTLENTSYDFVIVPDDNVELVSVVWDNLVLTYNGEIQHPTYTVVDMDGNEVSDDVLAQINFELPDSKWAGDYTAKANVKAGANYFIRSGGTCAYKITVNAAGEGKDPTAPNNGGNGGNKVKEFFDKLIASHFPLWQVVTMAVAGLLSLIFIIKAAQYGNRAKKAKGITKKMGAKAYAALLPIFSGDIVALGLSNQIWSIMAFALVGVALLMFVIALVMRGSWKKAEAAKEEAMLTGGVQAQGGNQMVAANGANLIADLKRELTETLKASSGAQAAQGSEYSLIEEMRREMAAQRREEEERRRADEERHRQEMAALREEQAKRDEAMKMMLANMMGRSTGDDGFAYATLDDTDMLVQRVIAGLLPAVQQMMPEPTAYLAAPQEQNEELLHIVEEQNAQMQAMSEQMSELQSQLASMHEMADAVIMPDNNNEEILSKMNEMQQQIANLGNQPVTVVAADNSEDMKAVTDEMNALRAQVAKLSESQYDMSVLDDDDDDFDFDDEEEWDSILDEEEDDSFAESVIIEADGTVRKVSPNFRMRLKESSDKNREWYAAIKNLFCSQKGVTYRVCKRVEKIRYQGNVIAVIGIAKRSIKLWLALKPFEYDARRYHHKDVSDKPRFVDVPLYVRVGSDRALTRAEELILALFQEQAMEARKRYTDRDIQELIFTLKYNKLLTKKGFKQLLCQSVHVHDCDILSNEVAEKCIETKNVDFIDDSVIETVKLDDIDAKFQDGNRVTLDRLRKLGLVSEDCTGYVVTADKRLTKPLIVVANDFTMDAVKMIVLTGGRVIRLAQVNK